MRISHLLLLLSILHLSLTGFLGSKKRKKHKYKVGNSVQNAKYEFYCQVVTPKPTCIEKQESVFSVTGFLTFAVVSATAVSNVIANIDNNNNNNNNNDNNDNVNNNNQISDSSDATNMGNARLLSRLGSSSNTWSPSLTFLSSLSSLLPSSPLLSSISSSLCLPLLLCEALQQTRRQNLTPAGQKTAQVAPNVLHLVLSFTFHPFLAIICGYSVILSFSPIRS